MRPITSRLDGTPTWAVVLAMTRLDTMRRRAEARSGLGLAERRLFWLLSDGVPRTMRAISEELLLEQSTVNRQVNAALAAGYLRRVELPGESARGLELTDSGLAGYSEDVTRTLTLYEEATAAVPPDRLAAFVELFEAFVDGYGVAVEAGASAQEATTAP